MVQIEDLVSKVKAYDPKADVDLLECAYDLAKEAHITQLRDSGEPYISHPLEVATMLADMRLDQSTIITALLHDTVEDTEVTLAQIRQLFGDEVASLVDGVTKLTRIESQTSSSKAKQAENFRKLVLAMSNDIRVLLVKLADRVHNMRTLVSVKSEEKRRRIARETLDIFAPLAERIGMMNFKDELEDYSFQVLNPDARDSILARLRFLQHKDGKDIIPPIVQGLTKLLRKEGIHVEVSGRVKKAHSIWRKMHQKNISIEQLADVMAFRVVVESIPDCYRVLGVLHSKFSVVPGRFKDYISTPKQNNYQSLHTGIIGPSNQRIEIQIRTREMHEVAELGVAAHWQYKQGVGGRRTKKEKQEKTDYRWLRSLLEILENAAGPEEFLEHTKLEMFQDQVFCFTPAGDLITLPQGATPIDFAYAIHSEVGNHCVATKINGRMMPLRTILQNGDQVEITTSKSQSPSPSWERFVVTGKARANIRRFIRTQKRDQYLNLGRSIVQKAFEHEHLEFSEKQIVKVLSQFHCEAIEDLYAQIGEGLLNSYDVIKAVHPSFSAPKKKIDLIPTDEQPVWQDKLTAVSIRGLIPGMAVHYARCCHPLPGDRIVGIIMTGRGVTIHTYDCDTLKNFSNEPERWIDLAWASQQEDQKFVGRLHVVLNNQQGALANLTTTIAKNFGNIVNLKVTNRTELFFEFNIDLEVRNADHLSEITASLRASPVVHSVDRVRQ
jgi:guanosine-3',5'-bis(diphosphate) 3'-pyrophosphohydrolase